MALAADVDIAKLHAALDEHVDGEVRFDPGSLGAYAQDASNYRQVPIGVVVPRTVDAAAEAVAVCRKAGAPVLSRGGGTSLPASASTPRSSSTGPSTATGWSRSMPAPGPPSCSPAWRSTRSTTRWRRTG